MELHTQIKKLRTNLNLSQEELAEKVYVTRQTISNWENNKNYPDIHSLLLVILVVSTVLLAAFLGHYGLVIIGILFVSSMYFALKVKKFKKSNDIQTYKEIISFTEGKRLDEIEKAQELGKRPYQKVILAFACGLIAFMVCLLFIWLFKPFIFLTLYLYCF